MVEGRSPFTIDSRLGSDSSFVMDLPLCQVRLSNNAVFPWVILIPRRESARELTDLSSEERHALMEEIVRTSRVMQELFSPTKLNIATLGNVVPQLHVHVIARYDTDPAWPNPVWASGYSGAYTSEEREDRLSLLKDALNGTASPYAEPIVE